MTLEAAKKLVEKLYRKGYGGRVRAVLRQNEQGWWFTFTGGIAGEHAISVEASDKKRVLEHWDGYCAVSNLTKPGPGERVVFFSCIQREGRVVKVGPMRAYVAWRQKNGRVCKRWIGFEQLTLPRDFGRAPKAPRPVTPEGTPGGTP